MKHDEKPEPHSTFPLEQLKETFTTAYGPHPDVVDWKKDLGDLFLAARNKTSEEEPVALVIFAAVELVDRLLQAQKDEIREDEIAFLKRAKLECDVIVCDCGEPYKDSDLAKIITDRLSTLKPHD